MKHTHLGPHAAVHRQRVRVNFLRSFETPHADEAEVLSAAKALHRAARLRGRVEHRLAVHVRAAQVQLLHHRLAFCNEHGLSLCGALALTLRRDPLHFRRRRRQRGTTGRLLLLRREGGGRVREQLTYPRREREPTLGLPRPVDDLLGGEERLQLGRGGATHRALHLNTRNRHAHLDSTPQLMVR